MQNSEKGVNLTLALNVIPLVNGEWGRWRRTCAKAAKQLAEISCVPADIILIRYVSIYT